MDLLEFCIHFIGNVFVIIFSVLCWIKLSKIKKSKLSTVFVVILLALLLTLISSFFPNPIKLIMTFLLLITGNYFFINQRIKFAIISVTITQLILALSEFSFAIITSIIYTGDIQLLTKQPLIVIIINLYVAILSFIFQKIGFAKWLFNLLHSKTNKNRNVDSIIYPAIIIIIMIVATMETYMELSFTVVVITNTVMAIIFIGIVITSRKLKENYQKINSKYETSISSLKEYEVMIDKFRVDTHENKNEILTIRNMIRDDGNKEKIIKYIDKLVDNKIKDNDKIMKQTAKIPKGGLRAAIYSKLCLMDKLKIKYNLNISREIRTTDLINLDEDLVLKICKILGVFLDNAIEAVKGLRKKEISIEMYTIDNQLCIDITNNFKGTLELDKIANMKYTTKGDGHGYGLTLVNNILNEEQDTLENEKGINRDTFTQTLKIKM